MAVITGRLDITTLAPVRGFPGAYLLAPVEASWQAVCDEVERRYGWRPTLTSAGDAYRSYAIQERIFRQRYTPDRVTGIDPRWWNGRLWWRLPGVAAAAVPGTSNHGRGDTVDVAGMAYGTRHFDQFAEVATAHGWSNTEGRSVGEAWHWTKTGPGTTTPAAPEDDMSIADIQTAIYGLWQQAAERSTPTGRNFAKYVTNVIVPSVWATPVARGDQSIPAIQELADAKTLAAQANARSVAILQAVSQIPGVDADALAATVAAAVGRISAADIADTLAARLAD